MKIIGSDYDGTFNAGGVDEKKIAAVKKWRDAGNKFGVVSGRGGDFRAQINSAYPDLVLDFFAVCNGGYIMDADGNLIYSAACTELSVVSFAEDLFAHGCKYLNIVIGDRCVCALLNMADRPAHVLRENAYLLKDMPKIDSFYQISVYGGTLENTAKLVEYIRKEYGKFLNPLQNGANIDIVPSGVNKAQGLYRVMSFFGCSYDDVITVGDNFNDMDMIREFRSYAMKSGVSELKAVATGVVDDIIDVMALEMED